MKGPSAHSLYLLFTPAACRAEPWATLEAALDGGVDLVQWRSKRADEAAASRCVQICARYAVPVIVNDDVDLAIRIGARGAHVGQSDLPAALARARLGPEPWLGVSTHDQVEISRAQADGADHIGFGPVFATTTKGYAAGCPRGALALARARSALPLFAIGGIGPDNVAAVVAAGCRRIAVAAAVLGAADPRRAAAALRRGLGR